MRRGVVLAGLVMIGCGPRCDDNPPGGSSFDVRVDTAALPVFHHLELYYGDGFMDPMPIATPAILAGAALPAKDATSWGGGYVVRIDRGQDPRHRWQLTGFSHPIYVGVAAVDRTGGVLAGGSSGPIDGPANPEITIALDPALRPELWGSPSEYGRCFRLSTGSSTFFVTRGSDRDCDGIDSAQDLQPYAFCDPAATSQAARDACR